MSASLITLNPRSIIPIPILATTFAVAEGIPCYAANSHVTDNPGNGTLWEVPTSAPGGPVSRTRCFVKLVFFIAICLAERVEIPVMADLERFVDATFCVAAAEKECE